MENEKNTFVIFISYNFLLSAILLCPYARVW